jgi:hypothetical protein
VSSWSHDRSTLLVARDGCTTTWPMRGRSRGGVQDGVAWKVSSHVMLRRSRRRREGPSRVASARAEQPHRASATCKTAASSSRRISPTAVHAGDSSTSTSRFSFIIAIRDMRYARQLASLFGQQPRTHHRASSVARGCAWAGHREGRGQREQRGHKIVARRRLCRVKFSHPPTPLDRAPARSGLCCEDYLFALLDLLALICLTCLTWQEPRAARC